MCVILGSTMKLSHSQRLKKAWTTRRKNGNEEPWNKSECPDVLRLKLLYLEELRGSWAIAKEFKVSQRLVMTWLKRYGVPIRTLSQAAKLSLNGFKEGEKHSGWRGDAVGYNALHAWVRRYKGTPQKCEKCGTEEPKRYEWANISGRYLRDVDDWKRLCPSCHRKMDAAKRQSKKTKANTMAPDAGNTMPTHEPLRLK